MNYLGYSFDSFIFLRAKKGGGKVFVGKIKMKGLTPHQLCYATSSGKVIDDGYQYNTGNSV